VVDVLDLQGREARMNVGRVTGRVTVDLSDLPAGTYTLRCTQGALVSLARVVVQR
jgi:hypothetical protein